MRDLLMRRWRPRPEVTKYLVPVTMSGRADCNGSRLTSRSLFLLEQKPYHFQEQHPVPPCR